MITLALDAALEHTGWAVIGVANEVVEYGVIETKPDNDLSTGNDHFRRQKELMQQVRELIKRQPIPSDYPQTGMIHPQIAVERTDWTRGRGDARESWIREASAREALAIGSSAIFAVCIELNLQPKVIGPNEWKHAINSFSKEGAQEWCAGNWPDRFEIRGVENNRKNAKYKYTRVCFDKITGKRVPDHVTDALCLGWIARPWPQMQELRPRAPDVNAQFDHDGMIMPKLPPYTVK